MSIPTLSARRRSLAASAVVGALALVLAGTTTASASTATATGTDTAGLDPNDVTCSAPVSIGFEDLSDGTDIRTSPISGLQFSSADDGPWSVLDFGTDAYNGGYAHQGAKSAYLPQGDPAGGRIDFLNGPASTFSLLAEAGAYGVSLEAYDSSDTLLATAGPLTPNANTGTIDQLTVASSDADIAYVIVHDHGNYFLVDGLCTDAGFTKVQQSVSFTSTPPTHAVIGNTYVASATGGGSENPVTLSIASGSAKICTISATGTVTFKRAGTCSINADQAGDDVYAAAPTATQNISVSTAKAAQSIRFTSTPPSPAVAGGSYTVTATGGASGLPVVFSAKASSAKICTVSSDGAVSFVRNGNCVIYATQAGTASYTAAPRVQQSVTVMRAVQR